MHEEREGLVNETLEHYIESVPRERKPLGRQERGAYILTGGNSHKIGKSPLPLALHFENILPPQLPEGWWFPVEARKPISL